MPQLLMLILIISLLLFMTNSVLSIFFEEEFLSALGSAINYLFSWEFINVDDSNIFSPIYKTMNILKVLFWLAICFFIIRQVIKHFKRKSISMYKNEKKKNSL